MDYIYDIVLNFQNNYYEFYEWKSSDKVINVKKIPVFLVNNENYLNLKYNDVVIDLKVLPKGTKMFLITNELEVMGILCDSQGKVIKRSSLLFDEADEVLDEKENIKPFPLKYKKNILKEHSTYSRIKLEMIKFVENFFSNIDINKDEYLLKYIYYDINNKEEENIDKVRKELNTLIYTNIDKIYNSIKKISKELNK